jgi:hypothetical protein
LRPSFETPASRAPERVRKFILEKDGCMVGCLVVMDVGSVFAGAASFADLAPEAVNG